MKKELEVKSETVIFRQEKQKKKKERERMCKREGKKSERSFQIYLAELVNVRKQ